ncbi:MAG: caspase family protein, partial [Phaeodactylibacter sp.]|nr:caspase family protein [Phaeodactylibacter sp.]
MPDPYKGFDLSGEAGHAPNGRNYLLVVAIDEYAYCPKLNNCVKDAREFIAVLAEKYAFEPENISTLFNADATRPNIHTQLKKLKSQIGPHDNLVLYFSGHGETEDNVGYWVPANAHPEREWEFFSTDEIRRRLDAIDSFHTFVIVDACFSGALFATYKSTTPGYEGKRSRWGLAASHSRERALDGTAGENSPFAATLLRQLKGSPANLPIQDLAAAVIRQVEQATEGRQTPVFKPLNVRGDDSGQYVFRLRLAESEASNWERLKNTASIAALLEFLEKYPGGRNVEEAIHRIEQLEAEDRAAWEMAEKGNSLGSYLKYIHRWEEGRYMEAARKKVEEFRVGNKGKAQKINPAALISSSNTFTDPRDGQTCRTVEINGQRWMAQNLNFDVGEGCWFYKDDPKNGEKYGRLYTWEAAKKSCPPGWRLPTDEEWQALAMKFGGYYDWEQRKDVGDPKKAYKALLEGGDSGFSALLGG